MNDINNISNSLASITGGGNQQQNSTQTGDLGATDFLELLVTQMQNQNPLEPQANGEFLSQLAQFGTVEGANNLNSSFSSLSSALQSNQALQASSLVGRDVLVASSTANLSSGGSVKGAIDLPTSASGVSVSVLNQQGELVKRISLGTQPEGLAEFTWDGRSDNGDVQPAGNYVLRAEAAENGTTRSFNTLISANVDSVGIGSNVNDITLNVAGVGQLSLGDVRQIN